MKNKIYTIIIGLIIGIIVISINHFNLIESHNKHIYLLISVFFLVPILRFLFPFLNKLEIGTVNFFPNLFKFIFKKQK